MDHPEMESHSNLNATAQWVVHIQLGDNSIKVAQATQNAAWDDSYRRAVVLNVFES